jgi:hypothetical protein
MAAKIKASSKQRPKAVAKRSIKSGVEEVNARSRKLKEEVQANQGARASAAAKTNGKRAIAKAKNGALDGRAKGSAKRLSAAKPPDKKSVTKNPATKSTPRLRRSADPVGYWLGEDFREGFADDPALTQGQRLRLAGWARSHTPDRFDETQRALLDDFNPAPSSARKQAEELSSYKVSPIWRMLDNSQRALVEEPGRAPALAGATYPLRTSQLAQLVGATEDQVRYWNSSGLLPAQRTQGGQRRFYATAAMWGFLLDDLGPAMLHVLRMVNRGEGGKLLVAIDSLERGRPDDQRELGLAQNAKG